MNRLVFPQPLYRSLLAQLDLQAGIESAAIAFTVPARGAGDEPVTRFLVREIWGPCDDDYIARQADRVTLRGEFILRALVHAQQTRTGVVFVHSHPFQSVPNFSPIDDLAETQLASLFAARAPNRRHMALVVGIDRARGRMLGSGEEMLVESVGLRFERHSPFQEDALSAEEESRYDRQIRAIGEAGQQAIGQLRIGIVGTGGTGSHVAQQLAYLGFRNFVLIDPQKLENTNTNRVAGSLPADVGRNKVEIASDMICGIRPDADVECIVGDVCDGEVLAALCSVDAIMVCTDSHGSRAVINRLTYQYLIPAIDLGSHMGVKGSGDVQIYGRVQLLAPGCACLQCHLVLDADHVRLDLLGNEARARDPYGMPAHVTQPAVISVNGVVSSLAVTMLLQVLTPISGEARCLRYDGVTGRVRELVAHCLPRCPDCAPRYAVMGDNQKLLSRAPELADA